MTFQEFLAARWLAKRRREAFPHLQHHLADPWWREVLLLTYGFGQADDQPSARDYLSWLSTQTDNGETRLAGLELAGSALLELERPNPEIRQQQAERLTKALQDHTLSATGILRARAGNTLARLGDPRFRADTCYLPDEPMLGFVEIRAGPFLMGSDPKKDQLAYDDEYDHKRRQCKVDLPRYYIARYPVTVAQFRAFVEDSGYQPENEDSLRGLPNHPVVNVSWYEVLKYCDWLTEHLRAWQGTPEPLATLLCREGWRVSLPSEAEWEKAARGTDGRIYPWGDKPDPERANYDETGINTTSAVGCFPAADLPSGCLDMAGNVWEWTRSLWGTDYWQEPKFKYPYDSKDGREDLKAPRNVLRVRRGGAFWDDRRDVRCASRGGLLPNLRNWYFGFRVVLLP